MPSLPGRLLAWHAERGGRRGRGFVSCGPRRRLTPPAAYDDRGAVGAGALIRLARATEVDHLVPRRRAAGR